MKRVLGLLVIMFFALNPVGPLWAGGSEIVGNDWSEAVLAGEKPEFYVDAAGFESLRMSFDSGKLPKEVRAGDFILLTWPKGLKEPIVGPKTLMNTKGHVLAEITSDAKGARIIFREDIEEAAPFRANLEWQAGKASVSPGKTIVKEPKAEPFIDARGRIIEDKPDRIEWIIRINPERKSLESDVAFELRFLKSQELIGSEMSLELEDKKGKLEAYSGPQALLDFQKAIPMSEVSSLKNQLSLLLPREQLNGKSLRLRMETKINDVEEKNFVNQGQVSYQLQGEKPVFYAGVSCSAERPETSSPVVKDIPLMVQWLDDKDELSEPGLKELIVELYQDGQKTGQTLVLDADSKWSGRFMELPVYKDEAQKSPHLYTVKILGEDRGLLQEGSQRFISSVEDLKEEGFVLRLRAISAPVVTEVGRTSLKVSKLWLDSQGKTLPPPVDKLTIALYKNGIDTNRRLEVSGANQWTAVFQDLPERESPTARLNVYTAKEVGEDKGKIVLKGKTYEVSGFLTKDKEYVISNKDQSPLATGSQTAQQKGSPPTSMKSVAPKTFDPGIMSYIVLVLMAGGLLVFLTRRGRS